MAKRATGVRGLHAARLSKAADNPREVAFAEQWIQENSWNDLLSALAEVQCDESDPLAERVIGGGFDSGHIKRPVGEITERDRIIAATLVQWLGSNVGLSFLRESLKRCGYRIVSKEDE